MAVPGSGVPPPSAGTAPLIGPLFGLVAGLISAGIGLAMLTLARWRLDALSRRELLATIEEYRNAKDDSDVMLAGLREKFGEAERQLEDIARRLKREEQQSFSLLRAGVRRDRYIRRLQNVLRRAGIAVPPEPEESEES